MKDTHMTLCGFILLEFGVFRYFFYCLAAQRAFKATVLEK